MMKVLPIVLAFTAVAYANTPWYSKVYNAMRDDTVNDRIDRLERRIDTLAKMVRPHYNADPYHYQTIGPRTFTDVLHEKESMSTRDVWVSRDKHTTIKLTDKAALTMKQRGKEYTIKTKQVGDGPYSMTMTNNGELIVFGTAGIQYGQKVLKPGRKTPKCPCTAHIDPWTQSLYATDSDQTYYSGAKFTSL